ncbi:hypothetical protein HA466_0179590 [Hirschfeldia incana]|nr:hypothetical protein HA466_0179590 [Hirschfeldia incana]KAJ0245495.1 hypothetical protein HA466_0179590 [Hirschfeldia incana]KAJ0245496.1 hypothetical protein HA466_0179590 [Hirschfeldia incana]
MNNTQELITTRYARQRRKELIDLNQAPPRDQEGTSASPPTRLIIGGGNLQAWHPIDVDAIEDDVVESSATDFAEAISKSSGARRRRLTVGVESGGTSRFSPNKRRRVPPDQPVIDCEDVSPAPPPPPPEEPKFSCPICMCPFTEEMSTRCGHIFCRGCIRMAISKQGKCPTCRKKVTVRELIRVFLPTTR